MKIARKLLTAALCSLVILVACTAGCTSPAASPSPQASTSGETSTAQSSKFTKQYDSSGVDPNPSVLPRFEPSKRVISPSNYSTGWVYQTKESVSTVKAFYEAQMSKLGYSQLTDENSSKLWSARFTKANDTFLISVSGPSTAQEKYEEFNFTTVNLTPINAVTTTIVA
jgi:hypothetical protein